MEGGTVTGHGKIPNTLQVTVEEDAWLFLDILKKGKGISMKWFTTRAIFEKIERDHPELLPENTIKEGLDGTATD